MTEFLCVACNSPHNCRRLPGEGVSCQQYLTLDEAFGTALGQLLFYGHMQFDSMPGLVMLLDRAPDAQRIAVASKLGVSVVVERQPGSFELLNPLVAPVLQVVFSSTGFNSDMSWLISRAVYQSARRHTRYRLLGSS